MIRLLLLTVRALALAALARAPSGDFYRAHASARSQQQLALVLRAVRASAFFFRALADVYWKRVISASKDGRSAAPSLSAEHRSTSHFPAAAVAANAPTGAIRSNPESGAERDSRSAPDLHADDRTQIAFGARGGVSNPKRTNAMRRLFAVLGIAATALVGTNAHAVGTAAGTLIENTATASFSVAGVNDSVSDTADFNVDEIINVDVTGELTLPSAVTVDTPETDAVTEFLVTNNGNGTETFDLTVDGALGGDDFDVALNGTFVYIDNGDGSFNLADETAVTGGQITLTPDQQVRLFVLADIPASLSDGDDALISVQAQTSNPDLSSGTPGDTDTGGGDGGVNAILGATGGIDSDTQQYTVTAVEVQISKTILNVNDFFGADDANDLFIPGAEVTYQIVVNVVGSTGSADSLTITDSIDPADGIAYIRESVTVDAPAPIGSGLAVGQTDIGTDTGGTEFTTVTFANAADEPGGSLNAGDAVSGSVNITIPLGNVDAAAAPGTEITITLKALVQ